MTIWTRLGRRANPAPLDSASFQGKDRPEGTIPEGAPPGYDRGRPPLTRTDRTPRNAGFFFVRLLTSGDWRGLALTPFWRPDLDASWTPTAVCDGCGHRVAAVDLYEHLALVHDVDPLALVDEAEGGHP